MNDLTIRLLAAIEETEYIAKQADHGPWEVRDEEYATYVIPVDSPRPIVASVDLLPNGWHIARHDPADVLRRCAADRKIVELYRKHDAEMPDWGAEDFPGGVRAGLWEAMVLIAEGYGITEEEA